MWIVKVTNSDCSRFLPDAAEFESKIKALSTLEEDFDTVEFITHTGHGFFYRLSNKNSYGSVYVIIYEVKV